LKSYLKAYSFLLPIAVFLIGLDQWTKSLIRQNLVFNDSWVPFPRLGSFIQIVNWRNTGAAFGIFQGMNVFFTVIAFVIILVIVLYFPQIPQSDYFFRLALALQLSGAAGNLIDRLARGYVTDFISIGSFPVFNIADSCITMGVIVLMIGIWIEERSLANE